MTLTPMEPTLKIDTFAIYKNKVITCQDFNEGKKHNLEITVGSQVFGFVWRSETIRGAPGDHAHFPTIRYPKRINQWWKIYSLIWISHDQSTHRFSILLSLQPNWSQKAYTSNVQKKYAQIGHTRHFTFTFLAHYALLCQIN